MINPFLPQKIIKSSIRPVIHSKIITRPYLSSFPACAKAMLIRYFIGILPKPPLRQDLSPKFTAVSKRRLFYRDISFLDWISTFIYKEISEKFQMV
jgi:hypothetical protein